MRLANKIAIVVGGGQQPGETIGNGRATAVRFAQEGATVLVVDINQEWAAETVTHIEAKGGIASALKADIVEEEACASIANVSPPSS